MSNLLGKNSLLTQLGREYAIVQDLQVARTLSADIDSSERDLRQKLIVDNPFHKNLELLRQAENSLSQGEYSLSSIRVDWESYQKFSSEVDEDASEFYWARKISDLEQEERVAFPEKLLETGVAKARAALKKKRALAKNNQKIARILLLRQWKKLLDKMTVRWRLEAIAEYRRKLLARLAEWLELLRRLAEAMREVCFDPGLLFDFARHNLSLADIEQIRKWAKYLAEEKGVQELCKLLGRMRVAARAKRQEWIETTEVFTEVRPDINSRDEIIGICLGNNIEYALPQEKALLADNETSLLFDIKFAESRLLQFDMIGWQEHEEFVNKKILTEVEEEDKQGPMIVCVDTSGSMQGIPETIAKAVTMFIATEAHRQKRNCMLINFSTGIEVLDLSGRGGIVELISFLQKSFQGGTDVAPAVSYALETMKKENYQKSDMLIISDFVMDELPASLHPYIQAAKGNGNRFHSLAIGNDSFQPSTLKDLFDHQWVYPPGGDVRQLLDIVAESSDQTVP